MERIRGVVEADLNVLESRQYSPCGESCGSKETNQTPFGLFAGEPTVGSGLVYLRARYYDPSPGAFPGLDA